MTAALFSRDVSQVLIALIAAIAALGAPVVTVLLHKSRRDVQEIKLYVNGRLDDIVQQIQSIEASKLDKQ